MSFSDNSLVPTDNKPDSGSDRGFPTPWLDYTSTAVPDNHGMVLWWAQYLWLTDGNFRTAMERVTAHFMTVLEFPDLEPDEESAFKDLFNNYMDYRRELLAAASDFVCYGNSFVSLYLPFRRIMRCQGCGFEQPIERVRYRIEFNTRKPYVVWNRSDRCPDCGDMRPYEVVDRTDRDLSKIRLNRYDPMTIEVAQNRYSLKKEFYWNIPAADRQDILGKSRIHIDTTPMDVLEAVAANGRLRFEEGMLLHQSEPCISGVHTRGWGIPRSISNFRTAWLQQLTNKVDQAVAIDYTLGMRVMSPAPTPGGQDPMITHGNEQFVNGVRSMVRSQRKNPTSFHISPYPIEYQFLGGEGDQLLPADKLKFRQQEFLSQLGVPLEYHQMNLSVQAAPMALRLFESYWQSIPSFYNILLDWIVKLLARVFGLEPTAVNIQETTIADDLERKAVLLQLMSANQLSPQTALKPYGVDAHEEVRKVMSHQDYVARLQAQYDEKERARQEMGALRGMTEHQSPAAMAEQQAAQQAGAAVQPGAAAPPGPMGGMPTGGMPGAASQTPQSLTAMSENADTIAQQLVGMDNYTRQQELKALREGNKDLHALVMQKMEEIRRSARSQGGQMLLQGGM